MLLRDVGHIGKDHREGDGKDTGHGDDCKVPPERGGVFGMSAQTKMTKPAIRFSTSYRYH